MWNSVSNEGLQGYCYELKNIMQRIIYLEFYLNIVDCSSAIQLLLRLLISLCPNEAWKSKIFLNFIARASEEIQRMNEYFQE